MQTDVERMFVQGEQKIPDSDFEICSTCKSFSKKRVECESFR